MRIAIVGAGFSGLLLAVHLLRRHPGIRVTLVEQAPSFGRGLAYGAADPDHVLNVRASNMSAFPDDPSHFLRWLGATAPAQAEAGFVSRRTFGGYLQALLRAAVDEAGGRLDLVADEAVALAFVEGRPRLRLAIGRSIDVDRVVLATGNLPPHDPRGMAAEVAASGRYTRDPWAPAACAGVDPADDVLLIGTGLTAVDMVMKLAARGHTGRITAISRRGLRPRAHRDGGPPAAAYPLPARPRMSQLVRLVRDKAEGGGDWRGAVDGLRASTQRVWREADANERNRFLRHLRPWWDVHRHRLAPSVAATIDRLEASGQLAICGGQIGGFRLEDRAVVVDWRPRFERDSRPLRVAHVVNCTGPAGNLATTSSALLSDLLGHGLARPDACALGLDVDAFCRVIGADGIANPSLLAIGPISRGTFWEITAVPDIRVQAAAVADWLAEDARACAA